MKCITLFSLCACLRSTYAILILLLASTTAVSAADTPDNSVLKHNTVILLYHHVAIDSPPSTSISPEDFRGHLDYLRDNDFSVIPLDQLIEGLKNKEKLVSPVFEITYDNKGSKFFIYTKKKYNITCERKFEINKNEMVTGFSSKGCF